MNTLHKSKKTCTIAVSRAMKRGIFCNISIAIPLDEHSDTIISRGRANANSLLGRFLLTLQNEISYGLLELSGGEKETVSIKTSLATLIVSEKDIAKLQEFVHRFEQIITLEYGIGNPDIKIQFTADDLEEEIELVLDDYSLDRVLTLLTLMPNGIRIMGADSQEQLFSTLNNDAILLENESFQMHLTIQCSVNSLLEYTTAQVRLLTEMMGGKCQ